MALNLIKLCVGCDSTQELEGWIKQRMKEKRKRGEKAEHIHRTRMAPKRAAELTDGGVPDIRRRDVASARTLKAADVACRVAKVISNGRTA